jgi:hypothetical protein
MAAASVPNHRGQSAHVRCRGRRHDVRPRFSTAPPFSWTSGPPGAAPAGSFRRWSNRWVSAWRQDRSGQAQHRWPGPGDAVQHLQHPHPDPVQGRTRGCRRSATYRSRSSRRLRSGCLGDELWRDGRPRQMSSARAPDGPERGKRKPPRPRTAGRSADDVLGGRGHDLPFGIGARRSSSAALLKRGRSGLGPPGRAPQRHRRGRPLRDRREAVCRGASARAARRPSVAGAPPKFSRPRRHSCGILRDPWRPHRSTRRTSCARWRAGGRCPGVGSAASPSR